MKIKLLFIAFFISSVVNLKASHLLGSELTYECRQNDTYKVVLSIYRDCSGIEPLTTQEVRYISQSCNVNGYVNLTLDSVRRLPITCDLIGSSCDGNGSYGVEKYIYSGTLNIPPCGDDWVLSWSQCCRNGAINTLNSPSSQEMHIEALLNNMVPSSCNSSPTFNNAPGSFVCFNQPVIYNHGVSDLENDSLYFSLGTCYQAQGTSINYANPYSQTSPLSTTNGITIDPNTGALSFTPDQQQVGVFCVNVKEYRNGVLISEVNRDMQFTVLACSNQAPIAEGVNGTTNYSISTCADQNFCFSILGSDLDMEAVNMSWNNEIDDATFTVTGNGTLNAVGQFCWTPDASDIGFHTFTVNVKDNHCPIVSSSTYTYVVEVRGSANIFELSPNDTICFGDSIDLSVFTNPVITDIVWSPINTLSDSVGTLVTAFPSASTNYEVTATFPDGCIQTKRTAITVAPNPSIFISPANSFVCSGQFVDLSVNPAPTYSYNWSVGSFPDSSIVSVNPTATTIYNVEVTDTTTGCVSSTTATVNVASAQGTFCNVLYVSPTGTPSGDGSKASPLDLETALEIGACRGTTIKMAVGDYLTDSTINKITNFITLEGGFDNSTPNWDKISAAGATRILRTATRSTSTISTSIVQGSGIANEFGPNPEIVAIEVTNQVGFRFQDITIETKLNNPSDNFQGEEGVDVIGVRLNNCSEYNIVRTQIKAGNGGNGGDQELSINAQNGGDSKALVVINNGLGASINSSNIMASNAGLGGNGNPNGSPVPNQSALAGSSVNIDQNGGSPFISNVNNFDLVNQELIIMEDVACTATNISFMQANSNNWSFGNGSTAPGTALGDSVSTMYNTLGRKNITYGTEEYEGFANILVDAQVVPTFRTTAPFILGKYRVCSGSDVSFIATNGGTGYIYHWDLGGASTPNNFDGVNYETLDSITFNSPGVYTIQLQYETNCCGVSLPTTIEIYVEETPNAIIPTDISLCDITDSLSLNVNGALVNGSIFWSPSNGLRFLDSTSVNAAPDTSTTYTISLADSTGLCTQIDSFEIRVTDFRITDVVSSVYCNSNNTGSIEVDVSGGSGMYTFNWTSLGNVDTNYVDSLAPGSYNLLITDLYSNCVSDSNYSVLRRVTPLSVYMVDTRHLSCSGLPDGAITARIYAGDAPYTFNWYDSNNNLIQTTTNTTNIEDTLDNVGAGNYSVRVTDSNNCSIAYATGFIPQNFAVSLEVVQVVNPTCLNATNGSITIIANGANLPVSIQWDDPANQTTLTASNLSAGVYCVTVIDSSGCTDNRCFTLTGNLASSVTFSENVCYETNYTFPNGNSGVILADTSFVDTLQSSFGCDSILTTNIFVDSLPQLSVTANPDTINLGFSSTLVAVGNGTFEWDSTYIGSSYQVSPTFINNTYYVTLEDTNGCISLDSVYVYVIGGAQNFIVIPNAFTPNNDGINDVFQVVNNESYANIVLVIYNRWGDIIHQESGVFNHGWDGNFNGTNQAVDFYTYSVTTTSFTGEVEVYTGMVNLIR